MGRGRKRALTQPILSSREPIVHPNSKVQAQAALQSDDSCEDSEELPPNVKRIPKILKDWVKIEYKKALVQYNGIQRTQGLESWITSTTSSVDRLRLRTERRKEMSISFSIPESRALKSNKKGRRGKKQKTIKGLRVMDGVAGPVETLVCRRIWSAKNLPSMLTWTHTERNIRAENIAHLTHIPFMGDDADEDFGAELLSDYEEGIHGVRRGWDKYLNDFMLQRIAQALLPKFRTMKGGEESFYKTIYYLFPNKYTVSEMPTRLADIAVRFSGEPPKKKHPRETFLMDFVHTITTLFCTRCFTFNCLTHGTGTDFVVQDRVLSPPRPLDPKPCGPGCFKKSARKTKLSPGTKKRGKGRCSTTIRRVSSECEIVQEYIKTTASGHGGPQAACRVAKMLSASHMTNKKYTCQELYEFLMESHVDPVDLTEKPKKRTVNEIHSTFRQTRFRLKLGEVNMTHKKIEPCTHKDGPCEVGKCHCLLDGGVCTKFCRCDSECPHRFPGCMCKGSCNTNQCPCFLANFECDPDLCLSCGVDDLCGVATKGCMNVQIQRGFQKRLEVRPSTIAQAGNGCFILEAAKKEELISEYTGEILEHDELERRGRIYDKIGNSYIFHLNQEQGIDAYHVGNLVRFANHLKQPNCRPKLMVINGEHRIGIFAQRDIKAGEELFFDYSYDGFTNRKFVTNSKRAYRRRNASKAPLKKKVQSTEPSRPVEKKKRRVSL